MSGPGAAAEHVALVVGNPGAFVAHIEGCRRARGPSPQADLSGAVAQAVVEQDVQDLAGADAEQLARREFGGGSSGSVAGPLPRSLRATER